MATASQPGGTNALQRKHRRIAYRASVRHGFDRTRDTDAIEQLYRDPEGDAIGQLLVDEPGDFFLVIPEENIPLVHVEATLEADHRVEGYEPVYVLIYDPDEFASRGVVETGERWDGGDIVVFTFESDDQALEAQEYRLGSDVTTNLTPRA
jgi:hypothetical protein